MNPNPAMTAVVPCRRCGYNLIGLPLGGGHCPECGASTRLVTEGDHLAYADPGWVGRVALGARLSFWGMVLSLLGGFVSTYAEMASLAGDAVWYAGAWMLTTPDPSGMGNAELDRSRRWARVAVVVAFLADIGGQSAFLVGRSLARSAAGVQMVADLVAVLGTLRCASWLARRASDYRLASRFDSLRVTFGVPWLAVSIAAILMPNGARPPFGAAGAVMAGLVVIAAVPIVVTGPMYFFAVGRLGKRLRGQLSATRQVWSMLGEPTAR